MKFNIPIVIIVYNRPTQTKRLLKKLESIEPSNLIIISDSFKTHYSRTQKKLRSKKNYRKD